MSKKENNWSEQNKELSVYVYDYYVKLKEAGFGSFNAVELAKAYQETLVKKGLEE